MDGFQGYVRTRTDSPPDFQVHAALVTLATALGNRVSCHGWTRPIYPNLWTVILAPSGYGKSAPLDMCEHLLRKAQLTDRLLSNSFTYEALIQTLKQQPVGTCVLQEFSAFLGMLSRDYNAGAVPFLTEVFDCPPTIRRVTMKGETIIEQPCLSILGASSPTWFAEQFKGKDLEGGFLARFLFCPSVESGEPVEDPGPPDDAAETVLAGHLREAMLLQGLADFSAVQHWFNSWDKEHRLTKVRRNCPPEFAGMRARAGLLVKKAAMLFAVSRDPSPPLRITATDLDQAIEYVKYSHEVAESYLTNEVARDADEADRLRLMGRLREKDGQMSWSELLRLSHMRADKFSRAVDTLVQGGRVVVTEPRSESGRKVKWLSLMPSSNGQHGNSPDPHAERAIS